MCFTVSTMTHESCLCNVTKQGPKDGEPNRLGQERPGICFYPRLVIQLSSGETGKCVLVR